MLDNPLPLKPAYFQNMVLCALMILITQGISRRPTFGIEPTMSPVEKDWLTRYSNPEFAEREENA